MCINYKFIYTSFFSFLSNECLLTDVNIFLQMYEFPECDSDEDEEFKQQDRELKASVPFAVVGSNTVLEVAGRKVRGRQYPWGVVDGNIFL